MTVSLMLALIAAQPVECPPVGTPARDRMKFEGAVCADEKDRLDRLVEDGRKFRQRGQAFKDRPLPAPMQAKIRAFMDSQLRDAASARYKWPAWKHPDVYCFQVNGKNAFGAYSGWSDYAVSLAGGKVSAAEYTDCSTLD